MLNAFTLWRILLLCVCLLKLAFASNDRREIGELRRRFATNDRHEINEPAIAIVGAGYAGLAAAYGLTKLYGFKNVAIYEALNRVGGRVHTVKEGREGYFEIGAQFVHSLQSETFHILKSGNNLINEERLVQRKRRKRSQQNKRLIKRQKKSTSDEDESESDDESYDDYTLYDGAIALMPGGKQVPLHVTSAWNKFYEKLDSVAGDYDGVEMNTLRRRPDPTPLSIKQFWKPYIQKFKNRSENHRSKTSKQRNDFKKFNLFLDDYIERWVKWDFGVVSLDEMSVYAYAWEETYPDDDYVEIPLGKWGYLNVTEDFVRQIPRGTVKLNTEISKINWEKDLIILETNRGQTFQADHVIVTSSLAYLDKKQDTLFRPQLSQRKKGAIRSIGKGCIEKVFLLYNKRFWDEDTDVVFFYPDIDARNVNGNGKIEDSITIMSALPDDVHPNVLELWVPSPQVDVISRLTDQALINAVTNKFAQYKFGSSNPPRPYKVLRSNWCTDPLFQISYGCIFSTEFDKQGYTQADLIEPMFVNKNGKNRPAILFAGEATSSVPATAHGAYWTGLREAGRIARFYGKEVHHTERFG